MAKTLPVFVPYKYLLKPGQQIPTIISMNSQRTSMRWAPLHESAVVEDIDIKVNVPGTTSIQISVASSVAIKLAF